MLETRNLVHRFSGGFRGLSEVSARFPFDELLIVTGQNGAGKSLLARHLTGLMQPTSGSVLLDGTNIRRLGMRLHSEVGLVFQEAEHQVIGQTVREDLAFGPLQRGVPHDRVHQLVDEELERFGLRPHADAEPHTLSGGELRRLAVAGVAIVGARYVILDEPFSSLDLRGVRDVLWTILQLRAKSCGVMVITHELEKVLAHADRLMILSHGELAADAAPAALLDRLGEYGLRRPPGHIEEMTWLD